MFFGSVSGLAVIVGCVVGVVCPVVGCVGCDGGVVRSATGTSFFTSWLPQAATSVAIAMLRTTFFTADSFSGEALGVADSGILRPAQFVGNGPHAGSRTSPADDTRRWRTRPSLETAASWPRPFSWAS